MRRLLVCVLALLACAALAIALWRGPHEESVTVEVVNSSYALTGTQNVAAVADRVAVVQVVSELADLTMQVGDVAAGTAYVPTAEVVRLAEDTVADAVERLEVGSLVDDLDALGPQWPDQLTRRLPAGTRATALTVTEVEARLTGGAA